MKNENTASRPFRGIYDGTVQVPTASQPKAASIGDDAWTLIGDIKKLVDLADAVGRSRQSNNCASNSSAVEKLVDLKMSIEERILQKYGRTAQHQSPAVQADSVARAEHPELNVPIDSACSAKLDDLGDNRGQGLAPYWKYGFRTGWHYAKVTDAAQSADKPSVSEREKALQKNSDRYQFLREADLEELKRVYYPNSEVPGGDEFDRIIDDAIRTLAVSASADGSGPMPVTQEPKYGIRNNRLFNRASGEFIPADEPVFIFRARDYKACAALQGYMSMFGPVPHRAAIEGRVKDFRIFSQDFPERMKEPDTQNGGSEKMK